jgi:hypothetical protein
MPHKAILLFEDDLKKDIKDAAEQYKYYLHHSVFNYAMKAMAGKSESHNYLMQIYDAIVETTAESIIDRLCDGTDDGGEE